MYKLNSFIGKPGTTKDEYHFTTNKLLLILMKQQHKLLTPLK
jgi:hypothetical protein